MDLLINNIKNVLKQNQSLESCDGFLKEYNSEDWKEFIKHNSNFNKDYNKILIFKNNNFEIYLIIWEKNGIAKMHNHASNGCLMKILEGSIKETQYHSETKQELDYKTYTQDNTSFIHDSLFYHSIENINNDKSMTLHIYSPPEHKTQYFD
jgi:cysteine dioxygenase